MGLFSGFMQTLGNAAPYAANALAARAQGQQVASDRQRQDALQQLMQQRQAGLDANLKALQQAQIQNYASQGERRTAQNEALDNPWIPVGYQQNAAGDIIRTPGKVRANAPNAEGVFDTGVQGKPFNPVINSAEWRKGIEFQAKTNAANRAPDRVLVQTVGPDGNPVWTPRPQAAGQEPVVRAAGDTPQARLTGARLGQAVSELNYAHEKMQPYEAKLRARTADISGLEQYLSEVGSDFAASEPAKQAAALWRLNRANPELARYIRMGLAFAEAESGINQRPSDFRTKMATFLSTAPTGASPEMIDDIFGRRERMVTAVNKSQEPRGGARSAAAPAKATTTTGASAGKPVINQAGYDEGRRRGHTDAEIGAAYDIPTTVVRKP